MSSVFSEVFSVLCLLFYMANILCTVRVFSVNVYYESVLCKCIMRVECIHMVYLSSVWCVLYGKCPYCGKCVVYSVSTMVPIVLMNTPRVSK